MLPTHSLQSVARMILKVKIHIGSYQLNTPLSLPKDLKVKPRLPFLHPCSWNRSFWPHWTVAGCWIHQASSSLGFLDLPLTLPRSPPMWLFRRLALYLSGFSLNAPSSNGYFSGCPSYRFASILPYPFLVSSRELLPQFCSYFLLQVCCLPSQR